MPTDNVWGGSENRTSPEEKFVMTLNGRLLFFEEYGRGDTLLTGLPLQFTKILNVKTSFF